MATIDTEKYTRINLMLVKGGTKLTRRLFLQRIKDLSPPGQEYTVDEFLNNNKTKILKTTTGKNKSKTLYPSSGNTNLDDWDLYLLCFVLEEICDLKFINKKDVEKLQKMRNKLCHVNEPTLTNDEFEERLEKLKIIFTRFLRLINDAEFATLLNEDINNFETGPLSVTDIVKFNHQFSQIELQRFEIIANQNKMLDNQTKMMESQDELTAMAKSTASLLEDISHRLPPLLTVDIPTIQIIIEVNNCSGDPKETLLDFIMNQFNENIAKPECNIQQEFPNIAMHKISEAVSRTFNAFLNNGRYLVKAEKKCILLTILCKNVNSFVDLVRDCLGCSLSNQLEDLQNAARNLEGCENVVLEPVIYLKDIISAMYDLVKSLDTKILKGIQESTQGIPSAHMISDGNGLSHFDSTQTLSTRQQNKCLRITIRPVTDEGRRDFNTILKSGNVQRGLQEIQTEMKKEPIFSDVNIGFRVSRSGLTEEPCIDFAPEEKSVVIAPILNSLDRGDAESYIDNIENKICKGSSRTSLLEPGKAPDCKQTCQIQIEDEKCNDDDISFAGKRLHAIDNVNEQNSYVQKHCDLTDLPVTEKKCNFETVKPVSMVTPLRSPGPEAAKISDNVDISQLDWNKIFAFLTTLINPAELKILMIYLEDYKDTSVDTWTIVDRIHHETISSVERIYKCLKHWKQLVGNKADPQHIIKAMEKMGLNEDAYKFKEFMRNPPTVKSTAKSAVPFHSLCAPENVNLFAYMVTGASNNDSLFNQSTSTRYIDENPTTPIIEEPDDDPRLSRKNYMNDNSPASSDTHFKQSLNRKRKLPIVQLKFKRKRKILNKSTYELKQHLKTLRCRKSRKYLRDKIEMQKQCIINLVKDPCCLQAAAYKTLMQYAISCLMKYTNVPEDAIFSLKYTDYEKIQKTSNSENDELYLLHCANTGKVHVFEKDEYETLKLYVENARNRRIKELKDSAGKSFAEPDALFLNYKGEPTRTKNMLTNRHCFTSTTSSTSEENSDSNSSLSSTTESQSDGALMYQF